MFAVRFAACLVGMVVLTAGIAWLGVGAASYPPGEYATSIDAGECYALDVASEKVVVDQSQIVKLPDDGISMEATSLISCGVRPASLSRKPHQAKALPSFEV